MTRLVVSLSISDTEYLKWYSGTATTVTAQTQQGVSINFPANILKQFVTHNVVQCLFEIEFDNENRFVVIKHLQ